MLPISVGNMAVVTGIIRDRIDRSGGRCFPGRLDFSVSAAIETLSKYRFTERRKCSSAATNRAGSLKTLVIWIPVDVLAFREFLKHSVTPVSSPEIGTASGAKFGGLTSSSTRRPCKGGRTNNGSTLCHIGLQDPSCGPPWYCAKSVAP